MLDSTSTDIVRRASIEELCGHRNRAIELFGQAFDLIQAANEAWRRASPSAPGIASLPGRTAENLRYATPGDRERWTEEVRNHVDRSVWEHLVIATDLQSIMDRQARDQFRRDMEKEVPPATPENTAATMFRLLGDADMIFKRGLVNAFRGLDRGYRSNDAFRIGRRAVMSYAMNEYGWHHGGRARETMTDVERVFCVMDGKPAQIGALNRAVDIARQSRERECRTEYFFCRWFGNGNMHVYFERPDLLERANKIIAEFYGATLAKAGAKP